METPQPVVLQTAQTREGREDYLRSTGDIRRLAVLSWLQANHLRGEGESARLSYYPQFTFIVPVPTKLLRKRPITGAASATLPLNDASHNRVQGGLLIISGVL